MKKIIITALLLAAAFAAWGQQKPRVAVATFSVTGGVSADEANVVNELFIAEMRFQTSDWSDRQKTAQLGSVLNVQYIIRGQFMKMGAVYYWTATMLDIKTAQVLYSAREQLTGMEQIFDKLPAFCTQMLSRPPLGYSVGDRGPGGGIVFLAQGDAFMECSEMLGQYNWDEAIQAAKNYRGGGFADWRLPTKEELNLIYLNLRRKNLGGMGDNVYWSSEESYQNDAWHQSFSDGGQSVGGYKYNRHSVRAVRAFRN
jgi:hypothetical protein